MARNRAAAPAASTRRKAGRVAALGVAAAGAAGWIARLRRDQASLESALEHAHRELRDAQARIVLADDRERRELERTLHEGVQQQLVALRIKVELARELAGDEALQALLVQLREELDRAIDGLRRLARSIYPAGLADEGLSQALLFAAAESPADVRVHSNLDGRRFPPGVETAVYYSCVAMMRDAERRDGGDGRLAIDLRASADALDFVLNLGAHADGSGEVAYEAMRDRLGAFGGTLAIEQGTERTIVRGTLPVGDGVSPASSRAIPPPTGTAASPSHDD